MARARRTQNDDKTPGFVPKNYREESALQREWDTCKSWRRMVLALQDAEANTALALRQVTARLSVSLDKPGKDDYAHNLVWWYFIQIEDRFPHLIPRVIEILRELYPHPPGV